MGSEAGTAEDVSPLLRLLRLRSAIADKFDGGSLESRRQGISKTEIFHDSFHVFTPFSKVRLCLDR